MKYFSLRLLACALLNLVGWSPSLAQDIAPSNGRDAEAAVPATGPVSREEYDRLKSEVELLRREMEQMRRQAPAQVAPPASPATAPATDELAEIQLRQDEVDETIAEIDESIRQLERQFGGLSLGDTTFLLTGNATLGYLDRENDESTFNATFRPVFLWSFDERLMFESKLELRLQENDEDVETRVEYANLTYLVTDDLWVGVGKIPDAFRMFPERFYPGRVADEPLIYGPNGLVPHANVGAFARGARPLGSAGAKFNYVVYVINGPSLQTSDPDSAGLLRYDNNIDSNNGKSIGTRLGFMPNPDLELGWSASYGEVHPSGFGDDVRAFVTGVDLQYFKQIDWLRGNLDIRAEWVWSDLSDATYDPAGTLGFGPLTYDNNRDGGYVEVAYRPMLTDIPVWEDTEFVVRQDFLNAPSGAPGPGDQQRLTLAVLYWIRPTIALRGGYAFDNKDQAADQDMVFVQVSSDFDMRARARREITRPCIAQQKRN